MRLEPVTLEDRFVRLEPISAAASEEMRAGVAASADGWELLTRPAHGEHFEGWWAETLRRHEAGERVTFAVRRLGDGAVVGTTSYLHISPADRHTEIGATFYRADARGGPVNPACKRLLLGHAFEAGAVRVEIDTDGRNLRSQAAIRKLGAVYEGTLRRHRINSVGYVRDTVVFSILVEEWPAVRDRLDARLAAYQPVSSRTAEG